MVECASALDQLHWPSDQRTPADCQAGPRPAPPAVPVTRPGKSISTRPPHPSTPYTLPSLHTATTTKPLPVRHSSTTTFPQYHLLLSTHSCSPPSPPRRPHEFKSASTCSSGYIRLPPHRHPVHSITVGWVSLYRRLRRPQHDGRRSDAPHAYPPTALGASAAPVAHAPARMEVSNAAEWSRNVNNWSAVDS